VRLAYADPPYVGQAKKHYGMPEVDHEELIGRLGSYDGWALSCSSSSLRQLLPLCPEGVRGMAWIKPFAVFKANVNPAYAWEPVLVVPARKRTREEATLRDWVSASVTIKKGLAGAKPQGFSLWLFGVLGAKPEDDFCDMFPGTGAVTKAWERFCSQQVMAL
jgi:hypothetical protein